MTQSTDIHAAIVGREREFERLYNLHDAPALAGLYTAAGQIMPPESDTVTGAEALETLFHSFWDAGLTAIGLETIEVEGFGETAYEVGRYTLSNKDGAAQDRGKYIVIWRNQSGQWKLHRDIFNTSMPTSKPPSSV